MKLQESLGLRTAASPHSDIRYIMMKTSGNLQETSRKFRVAHSGRGRSDIRYINDENIRKHQETSGNFTKV